MKSFKQLGLSQPTLDVLDSLGFQEPTPIQEQSIPVLIGQNPIDFIGLAQTGTGKTAAYSFPLIELIDHNNPSIQALILAPTRELGQQIAGQLELFSGKHHKLNTAVVYGGVDIRRQMKQLKGDVQVLVATPGRLLDLIGRKALNLGSVQYVVLDEADEMLNMGFQEDIDKILEYTSGQRVTWLFSATMPPEIRKIIKKYMHSPQEVSVITKERINKDISHQFVRVKASNKMTVLKRFMDLLPEMRGILFCRTRRDTKNIADDLAQMGYGVEALHGDLNQSQRDSVMKRFRNRRMQLLIATDVAARGIDIDELSHVFHYSLPDQLEYYTHRSGRTARAGKKGLSIALVTSGDYRRISKLEKDLKLKFEEIPVPGIRQLKLTRLKNWCEIIKNTKVDPQADELLKELKPLLEDLDREELLRRLITSQIDHLFANEKLEDDEPVRKERNQSERSSKKEKDFKRERKDKKPSESVKEESDSDHIRFFINVGSIDGVTKGDLLHFLSDMSDVSRKDFGKIELNKTFSLFDVKTSNTAGFTSKFDQLVVDGRPIRVNRDEENNEGGGSGKKNAYAKKPKKNKGGGSGKKKRKQSKRG